MSDDPANDAERAGSDERTGDADPRRFDPDRTPSRAPPDHDWPVRESKTEYETGWYEGGYDRVEQPDGSTKHYYWADLPAAVVVVAVTGDEFVMVDQYQFVGTVALVEGDDRDHVLAVHPVVVRARPVGPFEDVVADREDVRLVVDD